jgi:hypothetical protein
MQKLKNKLKVFLGIFFGVLGLSYFAYTVVSNSLTLFKKFDPLKAEKTYSQSQWQQSQNISEIKVLDEWAIKNGYTGWKNYEDEVRDQSESPTFAKATVGKQKLEILKTVKDKGVSDSFLYSYVGYKYSTGTNPSLLNPEHPPLAKYLIGYSIQTFGSEHVVGIIVACITLLLVGVISFQIHGSILAAGFALFVTSIFPLFTDQIIHGPQLELYQLFFFLLVAHMLLMWMKRKRILLCILIGAFFGMLLSTKTLLPFLLLFSAWFIIVFWKKWKELITIFFVAAIIFCLTYYEYFLQGGTLRTFLGMQKYIVTYYGNAHIPLLEFAGNYVRLIFTGSWKFWDSARSVSEYTEWNILWPLLFIVGIYKLKINWQKHANSHALIWFFILYNVFVFIIPIFPRYLLLLFIPLIILI